MLEQMIGRLVPPIRDLAFPHVVKRKNQKSREKSHYSPHFQEGNPAAAESPTMRDEDPKQHFLLKPPRIFKLYQDVINMDRRIRVAKL